MPLEYVTYARQGTREPGNEVREGQRCELIDVQFTNQFGYLSAQPIPIYAVADRRPDGFGGETGEQVGGRR